MSPEDIRELFRVFGAVDVRRLFGGAGIYADETMFALVHDGVIYLKVDEASAPAFDREGLAPFTYRRKGERAALASYRRMPDRLYDDPEELAHWARAALAAAAGRRAAGKRRATTKKQSRRPRRNTSRHVRRRKSGRS
jgi:DNA transformation protein and related proteins